MSDAYQFAILAALTLVSAVAAMSLRNLVHCALSLAVTFAGLAAFYLKLNAEFVGWAQILVYVGAVAILIVFAILLTRSGEPASALVISKSQMAGALVALLVFGTLTAAVMRSESSHKDLPDKPQPTVQQVGEQLMTKFVLPLEAMGLLLTAAAIGAVIIAMRDKGRGASAGPKQEGAHHG